MNKLDKKFMLEALKEAAKALNQNEIPVGAVIVDAEGNVIGRGFNKTESTNQAIHHAEIIAIMDASKRTKSWRLEDTTLYVTLEPCVMCYGAILESRIPNVVYGTKNTKGLSMEKIKVLEKPRINIRGEVLSTECRKILDEFFWQMRGRDRNE